ncbi:MAG: phenylalanine--tRNA ligase subunit beta [Candidatus Methanomethyliaceae archaeon]|nr:phenylalanine--tRNA ligase subunit beta [Candidatus Methanomethyliaceae archaeon]
MPTINIDMKDLKRLISLNLDDGTIYDTLSALKCEPEQIVGDKITLEVTSDRPDFFSCEGIARGIRLYHSGPRLKVRHYQGAKPVIIRVDPSVSEVRPYIVSAVVRDLTLDEEALVQMMQLQEKLHSTYCSNRKKGSIGIYDIDKVCPPLVYAALPPDEIRFTPLGFNETMNGFEILKRTPKGAEYAWILEGKSRYPLLSDSKGRVLSMPPIINSEDTKVTEETKNIIIDVTGTEERTINLCLNILVTSLMERGGVLQQAEVLYGGREIITPKLDRVRTELSPSKIKEVAGLDLKLDEILGLLRRMGHDVEEEGGKLVVFSPPYRADIIHEVDLVEDIVIALGLNNIEPETPKVATIGRPLKGSRIRKRIRDIMIGMGFQEVITYLLSNKSVLEDKVLMDKRDLVELINPVSSEFAVLRDCILPKLLQFLGQNTHHAYPQRIFECGDVIFVKGGLPKVSTHLAAAIADHKVSYEDIQAVAASLFTNLSKSIKFEPYHKAPFLEGRTAKIILDGDEIGVVGEISPQVLVKFGLEFPVGALECDLSSLLGH